MSYLLIWLLPTHGRQSPSRVSGFQRIRNDLLSPPPGWVPQQGWVPLRRADLRAHFTLQRHAVFKVWCASHLRTSPACAVSPVPLRVALCSRGPALTSLTRSVRVLRLFFISFGIDEGTQGYYWDPLRQCMQSEGWADAATMATPWLAVCVDAECRA